MSALDPALADAAIRELIAQSEATGATLVASLHAVDLALKWFGRIVGLRAGEVVFDLPAARVTRAMLKALYATDGGVLPTQAQDPAALAFVPDADDRAAAGAPERDRSNVVPLTRPGCR